MNIITKKLKVIMKWKCKGGFKIKKEFKKVSAPIIGADGNVFNLISICVKSLKENGFKEEAEEMKKRINSSKSYDEALSIMCEYIDPIEVEAENEL